MKDISKMTIEELKEYRQQLIDNLKPVGTIIQMEEITKIHNRIVELKKNNNLQNNKNML